MVESLDSSRKRGRVLPEGSSKWQEQTSSLGSMDNHLFKLKVNYDGQLLNNEGIVSYSGGRVLVFHGINSKKMSYSGAFYLIRTLGNPVTAVMWYLMPLKSMTDGLQIIASEQSVVEMFKYHSELDLYEIEIFVDDVDIDVPLLHFLEHTQPIAPIQETIQPPRTINDLIIDETDDEDPSYLADTDTSDDDVVSEFDYFAESDVLSDVCDPLGDDEIESMGNAPGAEYVITDKANDQVTVDQVTVDGYESEIQSDPEILTSPHESDDDNQGPKFPQFDVANPTLKAGLLFEDTDAFRIAVREHAIMAGFHLKFLKNEKTRVTAKCKESNCKWRIHASLFGSSTTFQIKSIRGEPHICPRKFRNPTVDSNYLAKRYMQHFVDDPTMTLRAFKNMVRRDVKIYANRMQLYRAKVKALEKIQGNVKDQYHKLRKYASEILVTNPGSTAIIRVEGPPLYRAPTFQRIFVMYAAQRDGFLKGCRPIIGLDACFLKGSYGGQLMAAIGKDGNNQMFPIAVAVVEVECKDSWSWFLQILVEGLGRDRRLTFISDRQKGLVETFNQLMPTTEHRYCVRHLYANFKQKFSDVSLKDLMWAAARSFREEEYTKNMNAIRVKSPEAYSWLKKIPPEMWCKFKMSPYSKCDMLSNNTSESFNNYIKEARELPILTMLETLRRQFMCRIQEKVEWIEKCKGIICPRIQHKLDSIKLRALDYESRKAGGGIWEIMNTSNSFVVNLMQHKCSCREWDLTGIPCEHATCAMLTDGKQPEDYVHSCYSVSQYKLAYSFIIRPIGDHNLWDMAGTECIQPPPYKRQPGRPRKARRKGPDEINNGGKIGKIGSVMSCSNCGENSHNKRSCKNPPKNNPPKKRALNIASGGNSNQGGETVPVEINESGTISRRGRSTNGGRGRGNERGRGRGKGRASGRSVKNGPMCGIGNWNGIGMSNMHIFTPSVSGPTREPGSNTAPPPTRMWTSHIGQSNMPHTSVNPQIQRQPSRFGDILLSSQSSRNYSAFTRDGNEELEFTNWGQDL